MGMQQKIPPQFADRAERRVWFTRDDADRLLNWIEDNGLRFLGMDVADMQRLIKDLGYEPRQRDNWYNLVAA